MDECFADRGWRRSVISVSTVPGIIRRSIGSYDPTYVPRFVRRLDPPPGRCLLAVKGWFAHGRFSMQRDPWLAVEVWCDDKLVGVLTEGLGRASQLVAPLTVGPHLVKFLGVGAKPGTPTLLHESRVGCRDATSITSLSCLRDRTPSREHPTRGRAGSTRLGYRERWAHRRTKARAATSFESFTHQRTAQRA